MSLGFTCNINKICNICALYESIKITKETVSKNKQIARAGLNPFESEN